MELQRAIYAKKSARPQLRILKKLRREGLVYVGIYRGSVADGNKMSRTFLKKKDNDPANWLRWDLLNPKIGDFVGLTQTVW